ncbi:fibulin-1-like protein [Leptotrombidium deliense]|uniref:Fibulin-1-like protein n=1 Tax=Leptotrombidium deliense TaxID=299467 RepID=A0A443SJM6_9ACAR|nr:fibulin-1-like protein [Leptotrombidium deliense]
MENALNDKSCRQDLAGVNDEAFYTCCQFCFKGILEAFFAKRCAPQKNEGFLRKIQNQCCQRQEPILLSDRKLELADETTDGKCKTGFSLNHKTSKCEDVDECKIDMDNCEKGEVCFNTPGSFVCKKKIKCDAGFKQSISGFCVDLNECETKQHNCVKSNEVCRNRIGSFECVCDVGYKRNKITDLCEDRNECLEMFEACRDPMFCENTPGSFKCICMPGFKHVNGTCEDIDECVETNICERCINTEGSYRCLSCPEGSHMVGNTCSHAEDNEKSQVDDAVCTHKTFNSKCTEIICGRNYFKSPKAQQ